jgi:glycosyltransferase involved in cell wall biosynthesis
MRVLHILNDVTGRGNGIVNTAVDLAIEQANQGCDVAMVSAGGEYEDLLKQYGVIHLKIDQSRRLPSIVRALRSLRLVIRDFHPDVIHAHMRTGLLLSWLLKPFHRLPLVAHLHNVHDRESMVMGLADRVIAVSQSVARSIEKDGIARRKIRVALNRTLGSPRQAGVDEIQPAALSHPAIVTVGGMCHRKGIAELISAFDIAGGQFRDAHLYLVGDGPERALFEEQARGSKWNDRIHFEGFSSQPQSYMISADIFVLASRRESFGLVLIEARQAGCAIIASDVDGISEALDGGRAGMLVPPRDVPALANALCALLGNEEERELWQQRALNGADNYHVSIMAGEVQNIYAEVLHPSNHGVSPMAADTL